jgi:predicted transcriptional regulator
MQQKTTLYLPDDLKQALQRESAQRGCSEAHVIREAIRNAITRPQPTAGLFSAEPFADRVDELMNGFGE